MNTFKELDIDPKIMLSIEDLGYEKPSPIQAQTLPLLLGEPTDFIGLAATGTGKTAAFSIPLLEKVDLGSKQVQVIVLCPTRELALQVSGQIDLLGKDKGVCALPIYGGSGYGEQISGLRAGIPVVVGTPGRVIDHLEKGSLSLEGVHTIVLDEADEMISMGFKEELDRILSSAPKENSKIWLFSATMSPLVRRVADTYLKNPALVQINATEMLSATVEQSYYYCRESSKPGIICKIIEMADDFYGIIFCQTKSLVMDLTQLLIDQGYKVDCLHGEKDQRSRERTMKLFRDRSVNVLVCTDVASRGLDVKDITHVINFSIPREIDSYVHRIGRTARSGKKGYAISLVTGAQKNLLTRVERFTKSRIVEAEPPSRKEIASKKIEALFERFQSQKFHERACELLTQEWNEALEKMSGSEIAGRFIVMSMPEIFSDREESQMPRLPGPPARDDSPRASSRRSRDDDRRPRNSRRDGGSRSFSPDRFSRKPYRRRDEDQREDRFLSETDRAPIEKKASFKKEDSNKDHRKKSSPKKEYGNKEFAKNDKKKNKGSKAPWNFSKTKKSSDKKAGAKKKFPKAKRVFTNDSPPRRKPSRNSR